MFPLLAIRASSVRWFRSPRCVVAVGSARCGQKRRLGRRATDAKATSFEAALAAQVAGQGLPTSPPAPAARVVAATPPHGTDYDALARMKAGLFAYGQVGPHHDGHAKAQAAGRDRPSCAHRRCLAAPPYARAGGCRVSDMGEQVVTGQLVVALGSERLAKPRQCLCMPHEEGIDAEQIAAD